MGVPFNEVFDRMLEAGRLKNASAVAGVLGVTPQALSNYKKRGEMPADLILKFAEVQGRSIDWLVKGKHPSLHNLFGCGDVSASEIEYISKTIKVLRNSNGLGEVFRHSLDALVSSLPSGVAHVG